MKKIGILFGQEDTFPWAFVEEVNRQANGKFLAEAVSIDKILQAEPLDYAVIIDRISQDVPFYRAALKNAAICGTAVINNPFWWSADEKFFNNALAVKVGVPVPKTALLPSRDLPTDTNGNSFRNLKYPLDWEGILQYVGFPAYMKPHDGGGWKSVYKLEDVNDLFAKHAETGQLIMMLQEEIQFDSYFRCYCIGRKHVRIMHYEPRNPHHARYQADFKVSDKLMKLIEEYVIRLNVALGYDFNTVEFAVRDGVPYAIDFCNPAPDADVHSVGQENYDWVVKHAAAYAIERAEAHKDGQMNLTWGSFMQQSIAGEAITAPAAAKAEKPAAAPKAAAVKATPAANAPEPKAEKAAAAPKVAAPKAAKAPAAPKAPAAKTTTTKKKA